MLIGGLEAGGTKMVCAIGDKDGKILERMTIPTEKPEMTMPKMIAFFQSKNIMALGIGCFGPIDLNRNSDTYGYITSTPKLAWKNFNIVGEFQKALNIPVGFDTDVNASLLGEMTWGIAKGKHTAMYITIGTGIGAGIMAEGKLLHGMLHPEAGHIILKPETKDMEEHFGGVCPYHKYCFEGLASGPSIEKRWGRKGIELADKEEVWDLEADYIAQAIYGYILTLSPEVIILGGGVMHQKKLFPKIRERIENLNQSYIQTKELMDMEHYIIPASLEDDQGILGAIQLGFMEKERGFKGNRE